VHLWEGNHVPVLSSPDASVRIACSLPVLEMADRLDSLQDLVAHSLDEVNLHDRRLRIAIDPDGSADLYDQAVAWAHAKKACCSYLGFAVEKTPARIVLEIAAPQGGEPTLEAFQFVVLAAGKCGQPCWKRGSTSDHR
jgi:hypothetical protein